jgi:predicted acetyltransferase
MQNNMKPKLVLPNKKYLKSWQNFLQDFIKHGDAEEKQSYEKHLTSTKKPKYFTWLAWDRVGKNLEKGTVPQTVYWGIVNNQVVGRISFRHKLNPKLKSQGGHIGYAVRPSKQGKGYATEMLKQVLSKVKRLGHKKVLLTCDENNIASRKTIENNNGKLEKIAVDRENRMTCYYWIKLP